MAELTSRDPVPDFMPPIPAGTQLLAVAWLRWRIFVNGILRRRPRSNRQVAGLVFAVLVHIFTWPVLALLVLGPVAASGLLAWQAVAAHQPRNLAALLLGIALLWQFVSVNGSSIAATVQSFDPASLVRFPMRFGRYFVLRSLLGLITPSSVVGCLALMAAAAGIALADRALALPALTVLAVYAVMNIYLTRMIGAWLERWLANRRFREIFTMLIALFFIGIQFLNLQRAGIHGHGTRNGWLFAVLEAAGPYVYGLPPGFAARAILLAKQPLAAMAQLAALLGSTVLFAVVFAIRLHKQFLGELLSEGMSRRGQAPSAPRPKAVVTAPAALPVPAPFGHLLSPTVSACLRKDWLMLRSNGTQMIGLLTPLLFVVLFSMNRAVSGAVPQYFFPMAMAYVLVGFLGSLYNVFGAEGRGVQLYFLTPIRIQDVVVAKNLLSLTLMVAQSAVAWIIVCVLTRAPIPAATQVSTALWMIFLIAANLYLGTLRSIQAPSRYVPGQGRQQRANPSNRTSALLVLAVLFGSMVVQVPVILASSHFKQPWLGVWIFAPLAAAAVAGYAWLLRNAERMILAHRDVIAEELCKA